MCTTRRRIGSCLAASSPASAVQWARLVPRRRGCRDAPDRGCARRLAAARRTGLGRRLRRPPARSSRPGWRGRPGCRGARGRGCARLLAAVRRTGLGHGCVARLPDRVGEFAPRGQRAGVLGTGCVRAHVAVGVGRAAGCRWPFGRQHRLALLNEGPQLSLGTQVLLSKSAQRPAHRPTRAVRINSLSAVGAGSELLARLLQPLLDLFGLLGVAAAQ